MIGLVLKDFLNLKKSLKIFSAIAVLYAVMAFTSKDASVFTSIFTLVFAILVINLYSYDEMAKWDSYALTLPVSRENIVQSKYVVMMLLVLIGAGVSTVFTIALNIVQRPDTLSFGLDSVGINSAIVLIFYCIVIPFITKLGVEKGRLILLAVYMIPFGITFFLKNETVSGNMHIPAGLIKFGEILAKHGNLIVPVILILALGISYQISAAIYNKKEF